MHVHACMCACRLRFYEIHLCSYQHFVGVMPDTVKTQTHLSEFVHLLKKKPELQKLLLTAFNPSTTRQDVIKAKVNHT